MIFKLSFQIFFILFLPLQATAKEWSLYDFLKESLASSGSYKSQKLATEKSSAIVDEKKAVYIPTVGLSAQLSKNNSLGNHNQEVVQTKLSLTENLFAGFRDIKKINAAEHQYDADIWNLKEVARAHLEKALKVYFSILSLQGDLKNLEKDLNLNLQNLKNIKAKISNGAARGAQAIAIEAVIVGLQIDIAQTQSNLNSAYIDANRFFSNTTNIENLNYKVGYFEENKVKDFFTHLQIEQRFDLKASESLLKLQELNYQVQQNTWIPSLDFSWGFYLSDSSSISQTNENIWSLSLSMPLPFDPSLKAKRNEAYLDLAIFKQQRADKELDLEKEKNQLIETLKSNIEQLKLLRSSIEFGQKNVEALKKEQQSGVATFTEVLSATSTYQQAVRKYDRANYEFEMNCYRAMIWSSEIDQFFTLLGSVSWN